MHQRSGQQGVISQKSFSKGHQEYKGPEFLQFSIYILSAFFVPNTILSYGAYGASGLTVKTDHDTYLEDGVRVPVVEICTGYKNSNKRERESTLLCGKT